MDKLFIAKITVFAQSNTLIDYYPVRAKDELDAKAKIVAYYENKDFMSPDFIDLNETIS